MRGNIMALLEEDINLAREANNGAFLSHQVLRTNSSSDISFAIASDIICTVHNVCVHIPIGIRIYFRICVTFTCRFQLVLQFNTVSPLADFFWFVSKRKMTSSWAGRRELARNGARLRKKEGLT